MLRAALNNACQARVCKCAVMTSFFFCCLLPATVRAGGLEVRASLKDMTARLLPKCLACADVHD